MKIHMIGHATIFVETENCKILMDPVLQDPFYEGLNESCPKREVIIDKIPKYDFLVISHKHIDHFDIRSLASLPKKVDVLIPKDGLIEDCLRKLGYSRIYPLTDFSKIRVGLTTLMTTRSEIPVPEFGMIFSDTSGVFWNAVDSLLSPQTIKTVRNSYPEIDFLLTPWHISMEGKYQTNQNISFPFALYGYLFNLIRQVNAKAIAPGAQGWKYIGESAWQNQVVFPVNRERFCHDIKLALPELGEKIYTLDPGDILSFQNGEYSHSAARCQYVKMVIDDREAVEFAPVNVGKKLIDSNPENYDIHLIKLTIDEEIFTNLTEFIQNNLGSLFDEHCHWDVIYQLEVVFPDGSQKWYIDFSQKPIKVFSGRNPLANLFTFITASSLYSLIQKNKSWDYLMSNGEYRTFHKIYSLTPKGIVTAENALIKDPIELMLSSDYVGGENVYKELEKYPINTSNIVGQDEPAMLRIGNILFKTKQTSNIL